MKRSRLSEEQIIGILHKPLPGFGKSEIFNADLGRQFTSATFICMLIAVGIRITKFVIGGGWTTCSSGYVLAQARGHLSSRRNGIMNPSWAAATGRCRLSDAPHQGVITKPNLRTMFPLPNARQGLVEIVLPRQH
jgi:hypothetical protein